MHVTPEAGLRHDAFEGMKRLTPPIEAFVRWNQTSTLVVIAAPTGAGAAASVSTRQAPPMSTSLGRKRAL
ncbi:hypothetical protein GCM10011320_32760 [Neoroseomonas lacus]|uniref:Uncharacterized protein n=1 Tax=Neoroseomonas lacus TaxID=287609 RepID=A0A917KQN9_9PROT|nr:hypothetical protein GCM10011320_32760 [Neoroseomonas lacus]